MPKHKTTNKLPKMGGDMGYGLGFFCGCLLGAVGTYIAFVPEGKQLKAKIIKEFRANQQILTLESLRPPHESKHNSTTLQSVQQIIAAVRRKLAGLEPEKSKPTLVAPGAKLAKKHYFKKK